MGGSTLLLLFSGGTTTILEESDLLHSPAEILRHLLVDLNLGSMPVDNDEWPVATSAEPNLPDNVVTTYDTAGRTDGRIMFTGEYEEYHGVQIRVRAKNHTEGWLKIRRITLTLDQLVNNYLLSIGNALYMIDSIHRASLVSGVGKEPNTKRQLFTLNVLVRITREL